MRKTTLKKALALILTAAMMVGVNGAAVPAQAAETTKAVAKPGENISGVTLPEDYYNRKVVGYFPNYAINSEAHANFSIVDLQWDKLTHVQYAFVVADENTLELRVSDPENDLNNKFEGREFYHKGEKIEMDESLGYYGQFNLMHTMMEKYPDVTVLASTGGWAASRSLWLVTDSEANMRKFANSAVEFVRKYGFDGIDIDFEFPSETSQSGNPGDFDLSESRRAGISDRYTQLIQILRETFDKAAKEDGTYYWVTSAVSGSSWVLGGQTNSDFLDYLDFVSVMSYDYHGGWNNYVENQANIYPDPADTETIQMALPTLGFDWSYKYYRGKVQSEKILMGVPYYTRGWTNVSGGDGTGLHGTSGTPATGNENIWCDLDTNEKEVPAGANPLWHVMNLMLQDSNYKEVWDNVGKVPHIWNAQTKTFLTFENTKSVQERINYVDENNLGGVLIWVMHGDYDYDEAQKKYVVGDTLTSMFYDQFKQMGKAEITSDIDLSGEPLDFDVDFGGKYDHPNYTYTIKVTNNTGADLAGGWSLSFDLPNSAVFSSAWGGTVTTTPSKNREFTTVTITSSEWQTLAAGESAELTGMIKLNFAGVKNFKLNGKPMKSEVEAEKIRLGLTDGSIEDGDKEDLTTEELTTEELTTEKVTTEEPKTEEPTTEKITTEEPKTEEPTTEKTTTEENLGTETPTGSYPAWASGTTYKLGDLISYEGKVYECTYAHTSHGGWLPGTTPTLWKERTDLDVNNGTFGGNTENDKEEEKEPTTEKPVEPGQPKPEDPTVTAAPAWDASLAYQSGDRVSYNGKVYEASWWNQGTNPESQGAWGPWKLVGNASDEGTQGGNTGSGTENDDNIGSGGNITGVAEWNPNAVYSGGEQVSYNGKVYEASWWNQGTNPEYQPAWGSWRLIG